LEPVGVRRNSSKNAEKGDLKGRLVSYASRVLHLVRALPNTREGIHIADQIVRSGTSPAPNYAEAQDAESAADFIHKLKIVLKELRETEVWLLIIVESELLKKTAVQPLIDETNELISIFVASVNTARKKKA
jgi:four helix bundle protein